MLDQDKIHDQCLSEDPEERVEALEQLEACFSFLPDKEQAWNYLHRLTNDEDIGVRCRTVSVLDCVFSEISDKQKAWDDLIRLANDEDPYIRNVLFREVSLPHTVNGLDEELNVSLEDIVKHEPTIASEIADRLQISESTISRTLTKLKDLKAIDVDSKGKTKYISTKTTGKIFLKIRS